MRERGKKKRKVDVCVRGRPNVHEFVNKYVNTYVNEYVTPVARSNLLAEKISRFSELSSQFEF